MKDLDISKTRNLKQLNITMSHLGYICYGTTPQYIFYCKGNRMITFNLSNRIIKSIQFDEETDKYYLDYFGIKDIPQLVMEME
jgi:hypothetical protein